MKENEGYRETLLMLRERFSGKDSITARELATYIGRDYQTVVQYIRNGELPGYFVGRIATVPITQLALFETKKRR